MGRKCESIDRDECLRLYRLFQSRESSQSFLDDCHCLNFGIIEMVAVHDSVAIQLFEALHASSLASFVKLL